MARRLPDANLPPLKTLEEFDFSQSPKISAGGRVAKRLVRADGVVGMLPGPACDRAWG